MRYCDCCGKSTENFVTWTCVDNEKISLCEPCADFLEDDERLVYTRNMKRDEVLELIARKEK